MTASTPRVMLMGANGFIGKNLYRTIATRDDLRLSATNSRVYDDITAKALVTSSNALVQMASVTGGAKEILEKPHVQCSETVILNTRLMRAAHECEVEHFIFPSCSVMYQSSDTPVKEEDFDANTPIIPAYLGGAWTKVYLEKMCQFYANLGTTKFTVMRQSNIYGPRDKFNLDRGHLFAATMFKIMNAKQGDTIVVWGDGKGVARDLLYVSDLCDFIIQAIKQQTTPFELVNVGFGKAIEIDDLVRLMIDMSGKNLKIEYDTSQPTIKSKVALDISKAYRLFDWEPKVSLEEGITKTMAWYKAHLPYID